MKADTIVSLEISIPRQTDQGDGKWIIKTLMENPELFLFREESFLNVPSRSGEEIKFEQFFKESNNTKIGNGTPPTSSVKINNQ